MKREEESRNSPKNKQQIFTGQNNRIIRQETRKVEHKKIDPSLKKELSRLKIDKFLDTFSRGQTVCSTIEHYAYGRVQTIPKEIFVGQKKENLFIIGLWQGVATNLIELPINTINSINVIKKLFCFIILIKTNFGEMMFKLPRKRQTLTRYTILSKKINAKGLNPSLS